jgi:hypothetical protein
MSRTWETVSPALTRASMPSEQGIWTRQGTPVSASPGMGTVSLCTSRWGRSPQVPTLCPPGGGPHFEVGAAALDRERYGLAVQAGRNGFQYALIVLLHRKASLSCVVPLGLPTQSKRTPSESPLQANFVEIGKGEVRRITLPRTL